MSHHDEICHLMHDWIAKRASATLISPTVVAYAVLREIEAGLLQPRIEYLSLEQLKQMARKVLAGRYEDEGADNPAYDQGDLFSGLLQERYPLPRDRGAEPQYKLRILLTRSERAWNVEQLRKSASARLAHADALEAEGRGDDGEFAVA